MKSNTFLDKLSAQIYADFPNSMDNLVIVLPNKRAKVFLLENLKKYYRNSVFAPEIINIEDFIQQVSKIRGIDSIELLFKFYVVYQEIEGGNAQDFDRFSSWANMLLSDFNEVDRYLLNPDYVFSYLKNIEDIKHWSLDPEQKTDLIVNYLAFWEQIPVYYKKFYEVLLEERIGYQGLIYREAVKSHKEYLNSNNKVFYFAGFNALNAAEEKIIQHFLLEKRAKVFWDIDKHFMEDPYHDAALFLRRIKRNWIHYQYNPFEWIVDEFGKEKNIQVIQTPKSVGQAKIAGQIVEGLGEEASRLEKVAIVLGEENLLLPVLHSLPSSVSSLNITMGYSGKSNPIQILLNKIFKMHLAAIRRSNKQYVVYYKEILDVLTNPVLTQIIVPEKVIKEINDRNLSFFSMNRFAEWIEDPDFPVRKLVFGRWNERSSVEVLQNLIEIVLAIKYSLNDEVHSDRISKTFLYSSYQMLNRLVSYCQKYDFIQSYDTLYSLYKQVMDMSEVSFEGEPLEGLQIMGVLESRVLDFDTVIVTSVNEGKFPAGKSVNSFIPYDVKREIGLPTYKEKDAIYSFHFYHLLLRAKNIYLLYNSQSEGMDAGEKSRFLTQLEVEQLEAHDVKYVTYSADLPEKANELIQIPKSDLLKEELKNIATTKGFSPSALSNYLRNPIQFYLQRVLRIREVEEVEESVALNTLGTIIHNSLENLYKPFKGARLTVEIINTIKTKADAEVQLQFEEVYNSDKEKIGKNLLAFEVAKRNVYHFLEGEIEKIKGGDDILLLELETELTFTLEDPRLPYPINLFGFVDRIEERNGVIRVIDYKSGKVEANDVKLSTWEGLTLDLKNDKIIQLLCYALMYTKHNTNQSVEAGIYSFKNRKGGFLFFGVKEGREVDHAITNETLTLFKDELVALLLEILNPDEDFIEKEL
ncbi:MULTISPECIES: PD-(D/E)XK nuclease family protein [Myroides]|uniref:PD-(D/E)XK nuclease family protein n=1 Tax=Myroides TaxID=76831 RepID=UPI002096BA3B|nr:MULTISPECIES: PD-(D/E)XK nuclease family protein [Myroides]MCO7722039.1 PD-(D/E)XK nuclease family protein [Myroides odoratimimus]MDM1038545.1 PD-(D/E)XK nuclease family protein [Myroides odoratimimus]MDM1052714.1 PD-(D/E)XK nuclease family protein [Myroides odoratimimus]MDM1452116.1 PD-(D/E)XK nuclease family protein [Myroides odoratimimus]MDM1458948.1 PD-(D/E)XK nuclease family protein [Myroides odoratimimus]